MALLALVVSGNLGCSNQKDYTGLDILVHIRSPEYIEQRGNSRGFDRALGLANWRKIPCEIWVPELKRNSLSVWQHEMQHCRDGKFH